MTKTSVIFETILKHGRVRGSSIAQLANVAPGTIAGGIQQLLDLKFIREYKLDYGITMADSYMKEEREAINSNEAPLTAVELGKLRKSLASKRAMRREDSRIETDFNFEHVSKKLKGSGPENWETTTYTISWEAFLIDKRNEQISDIAKNYMNVSAGVIVQSFLEKFRGSIQFIQDEFSRNHI